MKKPEPLVIAEELKTHILQQALSLEKFGLNDLAWHQEEALQLLHSIMKAPIGILGGDVYKITGDHLEALYDNWACDPVDNESESVYYQRSKLAALEFIQNYPNSDRHIVFALTFTEQLQLHGNS